MYRAIEPHTGAIVARSIVGVAVKQTHIDIEHAAPLQLIEIAESIDSGLRAFLADGSSADRAMAEVRRALGVSDRRPAIASIPSGAGAIASAYGGAVVPMSPGFGSPTAIADKTVTIEINAEYDIVNARGECRDLCAEVGFATLDQVKIATAVSELARNIVQYAGTGSIRLAAVGGVRRGIEIEAVDNGPGIPDIDLVLSGSYRSRTGMGMGLLGTKRIMDSFDVSSGPAGTRVVARKHIA